MKTDAPRETNKEGYLILPKEFIDKSFHFKQIVREGDFAIYRKWKYSKDEEHFEVFKIIKYPAREIGGNIIPAKEGFPNTEQSWGTLGFSVTSLDRAYKKLDEMQKVDDNKVCKSMIH